MGLSQWEVKGHHLDLLPARFSIPLIVHRVNPTKPQRILFLRVRISRCVPGLSAAQVESVFPPTEENRSVAVYRWSYDTVMKSLFLHMNINHQTPPPKKIQCVKVLNNRFKGSIWSFNQCCCTSTGRVCDEPPLSPQECDATEHWVCGSNGRSYRNHCELHRDACITKTKIHAEHRGSCLGKDSRAATVHIFAVNSFTGKCLFLIWIFLFLSFTCRKNNNDRCEPE